MDAATKELARQAIDDGYSEIVKNAVSVLCDSVIMGTSDEGAKKFKIALEVADATRKIAIAKFDEVCK